MSGLKHLNKDPDANPQICCKVKLLPFKVLSLEVCVAEIFYLLTCYFHQF